MMLAHLALCLLVAEGAAAPAPPLPTLPSLAPLAETLKPVVVGIQSTQVVNNGDERDPFQFFHRFFGEPDSGDNRKPERRRSLGSGFIISASGHIVSNYHVVKGSSDVTVKLSDGRELKADVVGR